MVSLENVLGLTTPGKGKHYQLCRDCTISVIMGCFVDDYMGVKSADF